MNSYRLTHRNSALVLLAFCFGILVLVSGCTTATRISKLSYPEKGTVGIAPPSVRRVDPAPYFEKYKDYNGVILSQRETIEHSGTKQQLFQGVSDWSFTYLFEKRYLILNVEDDELTSLTFDYLPDKFYAVVTSPSGSSKQYSKTDFTSFLKSKKDKAYRLTFPAVERGTQVSYGYENTATLFIYTPMEHRHWLQFKIPCESLSVSFAIPNWWTYQVRETGHRIRQLVREINHVEAKKIELRYHATDIAPYKLEPFAPPIAWRVPNLHYQLTSVDMSGSKWNRSTSWSEALKWTKEFLAEPPSKFDNQLQKILDSVLAGATSQTNKLQNILNFVRYGIERVDEGKNGRVDKILTTRKGSFVDRLAVAYTLCNRAGILAELHVVPSVYDGPFDDGFINLDQFDAFGLKVFVDGAPRMVFPAGPYYPMDVIPSRFQDQIAYWISKEGVDGTWKVPAQSADALVDTDRNISLTVDTASGNLVVSERLSFNGERAHQWREYLKSVKSTETEDTLRRIVTFRGADLTDFQSTVTNDTIPILPLVFDISYKVTNVVTMTPEEVILQTQTLFSQFSELIEGTELDAASRQNPIWILVASHDKRTIQIKYPPAWKLVTSIENWQAANEVGSTTFQVSQEPGLLTLSQSLKLNRCRLPKDSINELSAISSVGAGGSVPSLVFDQTK